MNHCDVLSVVRSWPPPDRHLYHPPLFPTYLRGASNTGVLWCKRALTDSETPPGSPFSPPAMSPRRPWYRTSLATNQLQPGLLIACSKNTCAENMSRQHPVQIISRQAPPTCITHLPVQTLHHFIKPWRSLPAARERNQIQKHPANPALSLLPSPLDSKATN